jgi:enterobacterial common antigen flippase
LTELFANAMHLGLAWIGITHYGLTGIGIAFFIMNILYWFLIFMVITFKYQFSFESKVTQLLLAFTLGTSVVFLTPFFLPKMVYLLANSLVTLTIGLFSLWQLCDKGNSEMIPGLFLKIKARFANFGQ